MTFHPSTQYDHGLIRVSPINHDSPPVKVEALCLDFIGWHSDEFEQVHPVFLNGGHAGTAWAHVSDGHEGATVLRLCKERHCDHQCRRVVNGEPAKKPRIVAPANDTYAAA